MTVAIWSRKLRETQSRGARITRETDRRAKDFRASSERADSASKRAERAAVALMASHDGYMRAAAHRR